MRELRYGGFVLLVEYDDDDAIFFGTVAEIGVRVHAETVGRLELAFHKAVDDHVSALTKANAAD